MYLTYFSTKSESCDHYVYHIVTKKKPTLEQLSWWLKKNASDKSDTHCYESIEEYNSVKVSEISDELEKLDKKDPHPEIEYL